MRIMIPAGLAAIVFAGGLIVLWSVNSYNCGNCSSGEANAASETADGPIRMNAPNRSEMLVKNGVPLAPAVRRSEPVFAPVSAFGGSNSVPNTAAQQSDNKDPKLVEAIMKALELEKLTVPGSTAPTDEGAAELVINALGSDSGPFTQTAADRRMPRCDEENEPVRMPYADEDSAPTSLTPSQLPTPLPAGRQIRMPAAQEETENNSQETSFTIPSIWQMFTPFGYPALEPAFHYFIF